MKYASLYCKSVFIMNVYTNNNKYDNKIVRPDANKIYHHSVLSWNHNYRNFLYVFSFSATILS